MQETQIDTVQSLGEEDPWEEGMATSTAVFCLESMTGHDTRLNKFKRTGTHTKYVLPNGIKLEINNREI